MTSKYGPAPANSDQTHASPAPSAQRRGFHSLLWRIHFWAALVSTPFVLIAVVTGILYIFMPQIESVLYADLDHVPVPVADARRPLDEAVNVAQAAAQAVAPEGLLLRSVTPAFSADDSVKVVFTPNAQKKNRHEGHQHDAPQASAPMKMPQTLRTTTFYVNPYTATVIGSLANDDRFGKWSEDLHSSLMQGDAWRWMIELAASAMLVMLLSGVVLWWPGRPLVRGLPQAGAKGRLYWKQWHGFIGVALCLISLVMVVTGLTWSRYAGDQIRDLRDAVGQAPPKMPRGLQSKVQEGSTPLSWQAAWALARRLAPDRPLQLSGLGRKDGVLRVTVPDRGQPTQRVDMALDSYSGKLLFFAGWEQQTAFSKATAIGIPFHRGEFGGWNQALLLLFGVGVLFSLLSGWAMYLKRWRSGNRRLPPLLPGAWKSAGVLAWLTALVLCLALPVLAVGVLLVLGVELTLAVARAGRPLTG